MMVWPGPPPNFIWYVSSGINPQARYNFRRNSVRVDGFLAGCVAGCVAGEVVATSVLLLLLVIVCLLLIEEIAHLVLPTLPLYPMIHIMSRRNARPNFPVGFRIKKSQPGELSLA